jgi:hypothetical protein
MGGLLPAPAKAVTPAGRYSPYMDSSHGAAGPLSGEVGQQFVSLLRRYLHYELGADLVRVWPTCDFVRIESMRRH